MDMFGLDTRKEGQEQGQRDRYGQARKVHTLAKTTRDLEFDYLAASSKIEELLQKKTSTYRLVPEIEGLHARLMKLGTEILASDNPQGLESEYLQAAAKLHAKLHEKTAAYALLNDVERLHGQLIDLGKQLGWQQASEPAASALPAAIEAPDAVAV